MSLIDMDTICRTRQKLPSTRSYVLDMLESGKTRLESYSHHHPPEFSTFNKYCTW